MSGIFSRKPISRDEAADLIDEFAEMRWTWSEDFDLPLSGKFEDSLLQQCAAEFFEVKIDFEENFHATNGKLTNENYLHLKKLSKRLREAGLSSQADNE
ncbi:MAG: hypothetical protein P4L53_22120 [Candidatus Obscuribacterales bacterium]|nr:hypothetical protein [Candidatus Obscuribacterales bacterium]